MPIDDSFEDKNIKLFEENLAATKELTSEVHELAGRFSAKEIIHKRIRRLGIAAIIVSSISLIGLVISGYLIYQNSKNVEATENVAKINCENANDSREANRKIWTLVVQTSSNDPNRTPQDIQRAQAFQDYINKLYAQRDCNDLDRRYTIPDPPKFEF